MHVLSSLLIVLPGLVSVSPLPFLQNVPPETSLHTFNTGPTPTHGADSSRPTPYNNNRRDTVQPRDAPPPPYTMIFWAFGNSEPAPSDLPLVQDITIQSSSSSSAIPSVHLMKPTAAITVIPSPTSTSPINADPALRTPHTPISYIPTPTPTSPPDANDRAATAALAHKHKLIFVGVIVGIVMGLVITVGTCKLLAKSGLCDCGGRKFTGAGLLVEEKKEKKMSWMRFGGAGGRTPRVSFGSGAGNLMVGVGTPRGMFGRRYDEKGIEHNPGLKGVTFEDENKVVNIGPKPDLLRTLTYQAPSNAKSATPNKNKPGIMAPPSSALGLKVGQTLHPAHFTTAHHLSPTSFFDNDDHVLISASPSSSRLSNLSSIHSRTKSAPVTINTNHGDGEVYRESNWRRGSLSSASSSEWDVARAYGGPRYGRARSDGAMSGLSVDEREWEEPIQMIGDLSSL